VHAATIAAIFNFLPIFLPLFPRGKWQLAKTQIFDGKFILLVIVTIIIILYSLQLNKEKVGRCNYKNAKSLLLQDYK